MTPHSSVSASSLTDPQDWFSLHGISRHILSTHQTAPHRRSTTISPAGIWEFGPHRLACSGLKFRSRTNITSQRMNCCGALSTSLRCLPSAVRISTLSSSPVHRRSFFSFDIQHHTNSSAALAVSPTAQSSVKPRPSRTTTQVSLSHLSAFHADFYFSAAEKDGSIHIQR